jgi:Protein of unknown function (DUF1217)
MASTLSDYRLVSRDLPRSILAVEREPQVKRETAYYLSKIGTVKTIEEFAGDRRLFQYAMKAHGLEDMAYAKAMMVKVLKEGRDDPDAFANRLADRRYVEFAETFDFARHGTAATTFSKAQKGVADKYLRQTLERNAGANNEGVRLALYFQRKASSVTSVTELLGDRALAAVTRTALGMPQSTALLDIDKQIEMFEAKLDVKDLKDPVKLAKFIDRFTVLYDIENPDQNQSGGVGLLFDQGAAAGLSGNLMLAIQNLKR